MHTAAVQQSAAAPVSEGGAASDLSVDGMELIAQLDRFPPEIYTHEHFRGKTIDDPLVKELVDLTRSTMQHMNAEFPGLPPDSPEHTLRLISGTSAHTVVLRDLIRGREHEGPKIIGYGIMYADQQHFPDRDHIPPELMKPGCSRVIRLFVTTEGRELQPRGEAFSKIIERIEHIAGNGPLIGMVLTDIVPIEGKVDPKAKTAIWLEAKKALEARGFEDTGMPISEPVAHPGGPTVDVRFRWYTWPAFSEKGQKLMEVHERRFAELAIKNQERVAPVATCTPLINATVLCSGRAGYAFDIAHLYPGNRVIAAEYNSGGPQRRRNEFRKNLFPEPANPLGRYVADNRADVAPVYGVLPDIAGQDPALAKERIAAFMKTQVDQLKPGGTLIVRDTVGPTGPRNIIVELSAAKDINAGGTMRSMAEMFRDFVTARREKHIAPDDWELVAPLQTSEASTMRFITPSAVFSEFYSKLVTLAKRPDAQHPGHEGDRYYTLLSPEERVELMSNAGLRLWHAAPQFSAWKHAKFIKGRVAMFDLSGRPLELPPTNYITIAQKVGPGEGVQALETQRELIANPRFFSLSTYSEHDAAGNVIGVREIAGSRDYHAVFPYTIFRGQLLIRGHICLRPIVAAAGTTSLDGSRSCAYLAEQAGATFKDSIPADSAALNLSAARIAEERGGVDRGDILEFDTPTRYMSRPDLVDELVVAQGLRIKNILADKTVTMNVLGEPAPVKTRMFDAARLLQGMQVGTHDNAPLERKIYEIMRAHKLSRGPWCGSRIELSAQEAAGLHIETDFEKITHPEPRGRYSKLEGRRFGFLEVYRGQFAEYAADGAQIRGGPLEYIVPGKDTGLGSNTITVLPLLKRVVDGREQIVTGAEICDVPGEKGPTAFATLPTLMIPSDITTLADAKDFVRQRMREKYGIKIGAMEMLGGKYRSSPGITPEAIYPMWAEVIAEKSRFDTMVWTDLASPKIKETELQCAQLITSRYRAKHALGAKALDRLYLPRSGQPTVS